MVPVFGVLLDGVVSALRNLENTSIADPPRMVGFALWGTAAEEGLGLPRGSVMGICMRSRGDEERPQRRSSGKQGQKECRQGPDGKSEGGDPPPK